MRKSEKNTVNPVSDFLLRPNPPCITGIDNMKNHRSAGLAIHIWIIYMYIDVQGTPFSCCVFFQAMEQTKHIHLLTS